jgi:hypothetical protein
MIKLLFIFEKLNKIIKKYIQKIEYYIFILKIFIFLKYTVQEFKLKLIIIKNKKKNILK